MIKWIAYILYSVCLIKHLPALSMCSLDRKLKGHTHCGISGLTFLNNSSYKYLTYIDMELKDEIGQFAVRIKKMLPQVQSEDLTRNALVMPFIQILGFDVFNPSEVQSEAVLDFGVKKSKKVDYTIMKDGEPTILVECKHHEESLDINDSRLSKYFRKTKAKYGLLTNGLEYRFYTEKMVRSKKKQEPLFVFNVKDTKAATIAKMLEEHKDYFNVKQNVAS